MVYVHFQSFFWMMVMTSIAAMVHSRPASLSTPKAEVACHCNLAECQNSSCTTQLGGKCFSRLIRKSGSRERSSRELQERKQHGCSQLLSRRQRRVCENGPRADVVTSVYDSRGQVTLLLCCAETGCNRMQPEASRPEVDVTRNTTRDVHTSPPRDVLLANSSRYAFYSAPGNSTFESDSSDGWLQGTLIAVPLGGAVIVVLLALLAARLLRRDSRRHKQALIEKPPLLADAANQSALIHSCPSPRKAAKISLPSEQTKVEVDDLSALQLSVAGRGRWSCSPQEACSSAPQETCSSAPQEASSSAPQEACSSAPQEACSSAPHTQRVVPRSDLYRSPKCSDHVTQQDVIQAHSISPKETCAVSHQRDRYFAARPEGSPYASVAVPTGGVGRNRLVYASMPSCLTSGRNSSNLLKPKLKVYDERGVKEMAPYSLDTSSAGIEDFSCRMSLLSKTGEEG